MPYEVQPPTINTYRAAVVGPLTPNDDNHVYLTKQTLGWNPNTYGVIILQCATDATLEVLGLDGATWITYPGTLGAGALKIVRGRWDALRVTTDEPVLVKGDFDWQSWLVTP